MNVEHIGARLCRALRIGLPALASLGWLSAAAQMAPLRYQHCEAEAPARNAIHRLETNYRYPPTATTRSFQGVSAYRCEPAWVQSPDIFDATDTCKFYPSGCSHDGSYRCQYGPDVDRLGLSGCRRVVKVHA